MATVDDLTRIKYVGQDFSTYEQEAQDYLKENFPEDFNDYVNNQMGIALLQSIAFPSQNLAFYLNQRITNLYLTTSTSPTAISRLARMLNYDIQPAISSRVDVTVTLTDGPYVFPVKITKGFRFNASKGLTYEYRLDTDIIYQPGETVKTFEVREGVTTRNVFVSDGTENQRFQLAGLEDGEFVDDQSFELFVGTEEWEEVRRIPFEETKIFEVNYFSEPPEIRFGDGIAGLVPEANQEITVNFVITKGLQGSIGQNEISAAADQLIENNTTIGLEVTSSTESSGGDDPEDLRKVKVQAPEFFQSQNRAITKRDYDAIVNTYAGIAKGDAQIIRSISQDQTLNDYFDVLVDSVSGCSGGIATEVTNIVTDMKDYLGATLSDTCRSNTVQVSVLGKNINNRYNSTTVQLREDLRLELEEINDAVHVVTVVDGVPNLVDVDIEVEILASVNAVEKDVIERAELALVKDDAEPFGLLILREYGVNLYLSDLFKRIRDNQAVEGEIEYMNIKITGPTDKLDSDGNLIIDEKLQEIIQPGNISVVGIDRDIFIG